MLPAPTRKYLLASLAGTPDVIDALLSGLAEGSPAWDVRPDPDRFTLREVVAHMAESEPRWRERVLRTQREDEPEFVSRPIRTDFAGSDPRECLARFRAAREAFVATLRELPESVWERVAHSAFLGTVTIEEQVVFVLAHDGYHTQQIAAWVAAPTAPAAP